MHQRKGEVANLQSLDVNEEKAGSENWALGEENRRVATREHNRRFRW